MKNKFQFVVATICFSLIFFLDAQVQGSAFGNGAARREVAITIDDRPAWGDLEKKTSITRKLLKSITDNKVPTLPS